MVASVVNGSRQTSTNAEFRRKVKQNLMYRNKWDGWTLDEKTQRADTCCSRCYPGKHFPPWKYKAVGVTDPGRD
eukprot:486456-Heterocapsa_arctica.AAC.1